MKGIIVSDLELILRRNDFIVTDVDQSIRHIKKDVSDLVRSTNCTDLKFLTNRLELEMNYFNNVMLKINSYHTVLQGVLKSYKQQAEEIAKSINKLSP